MPVRRAKNDTKPKRWQLTQGGQPVDLTLATSVKMQANLAPGQAATGTVVLDAACSVVTALQGIVREPAGSTGSLAEALYTVAFQITWNDGTTETLPDDQVLLLEIRPDPGT